MWGWSNKVLQDTPVTDDTSDQDMTLVFSIVGWGNELLLLLPQSSKGKVLHPAPVILSCPGLEDLEPKGEGSYQRHSHGSLRWKVRLLPILFRCLMPVNQQGREFLCWLGWLTLNRKEKLEYVCVSVRSSCYNKIP